MRRTLAVAVTMVAALSLSPADASEEPVSRAIKNACNSDAKRLCPNDKLGSSSLRYCMEANGRRLSRTCVRALEDEGVVPRGYLRG